jgi:hypothetical protein
MGMLQGGLLGQVAAGGGDTINLQNASCSQEGSGGADANIQIYNAGTNEGEVWVEDGGFIYDHDAIVPGSNANDYQMKWDQLSGDEPTGNNTEVEGVWYALSGGDFEVEWTASGEEESSGSVTVSIRKGTGSVLDTAVWDGEAVSTKKGQ